jgi:ABC-2 type transport system ATP-binding protein
MIGNPNILLLDEPSTGMDPEARHDMWNIIKRRSNNKDTSVIITTHLMEEAE